MSTIYINYDVNMGQFQTCSAAVKYDATLNLISVKSSPHPAFTRPSVRARKQDGTSAIFYLMYSDHHVQAKTPACDWLHSNICGLKFSQINVV